MKKKLCSTLALLPLLAAALALQACSSPDDDKEKFLEFEPELVAVEGGTFEMGYNPERDGDDHRYLSDAKPPHSVTLSSFRIGKYEVTQAQWVAVMGSNPSCFPKGDRYPVEQVSWDSVQVYLTKLNALTGRSYRLPTEAEWEYAARGGRKSAGYQYSGSNTIDEVAWYNGNSGDSTHTVGKKAPNELGIYDMSGNVWEWCSDWVGSYSDDAVTNPAGAEDGSYRVIRGGGWSNSTPPCCAALRLSSEPSYCFTSLGFRVVLSASVP
jgi:formylglycine-generating enzyme required for sulfatase activity